MSRSVHAGGFFNEAWVAILALMISAALGWCASLAAAEGDTVRKPLKRVIVGTTDTRTDTVPADADDEAKLRELESRLEADDADSRIALAKWAQQRGLHRQAIDLANKAAELDPESTTTYAQVIEIAKAAKLPRDPRLEKQLKDELGDHFSVHYTPHFIVLYDADRDWALARAALLERTHDVFYETYQRTGYRPKPLRYPLVAILFEEHEDYLEYAKKVDRADMGWAGGYYSPGTNRVTFFDDRNSPMLQEFVGRMEKLQRAVRTINRSISAAQRQGDRRRLATLRAQRKSASRQLTWYRARHKALAKLGNISKTTHEAAHQLAFNSGIQHRTVFYPFWFAEGLASCFETDDPAGAFGPFSGNYMREYSIKQAIAGDDLIPLKEMVSELRPSTRREKRLAVWYAQSWALYRYLFRFRRDALRDYTEALNRRAAGKQPGERELQEQFVEHFGSLSALERAFFKHIGKD